MNSNNTLSLWYIDYDDLFWRTGLWNLDFTNKTVLDIWAWLSDISLKLAWKNPKWNFILLDPIYNWNQKDFEIMLNNTFISILHQEFQIMSRQFETNIWKILSWDLTYLDTKIIDFMSLIRSKTLQLTNFKKNLNNISKVSSYWEKLPFQEKSIDVALMVTYFYNLKEESKIDLLNQLLLVLKDDWFIILSDYLRSYYKKIIEKMWINYEFVNDKYFWIKLPKNKIEEFKEELEKYLS